MRVFVYFLHVPKFRAVVLLRKISEALCEVKVERWTELFFKAPANQETFRKQPSDFRTSNNYCFRGAVFFFILLSFFCLEGKHHQNCNNYCNGGKSGVAHI